MLSRLFPEATVRRRIVPILSFVVAAAVLSGPARAQKPGPGQHETIPGTYTPDQIKRALAGRGDLPDLPPELLELLKERMQKEGKRPPDEQQLKQAREMMEANPQFRRQVEEMGRKLKNGKNAIGPEERRQLEELLPKFQQGPPMNKGGPPPPVVDPALPKNLEPPKEFPKGPPFPPPLPNPMFPPMPPPDQRPNPLRDLDPNGKNPLDPGNESPREKAAHAAASMWERNIGPLDDTPAVKKALFELVEGTEDLKGPDGKSFWEELALEEGQSTSLSELLDGASMTESWTMPKLDLPDWKLFDSGPDTGDGLGGNSGEGWWSRNFGRRNPPSPNASPGSAPSSGWNPSIGTFSLQGGWLPVVILVSLIVAGLLVWKFRGAKWSRNRASNMLYGPDWPLDPRRITTREHVVIAFEYLSVLICGPSAKTWTHNTIADALADLALTHGEKAAMLARLYELARYAPLDEPLTTAELAEARRLVCALAGLEHE